MKKIILFVFLALIFSCKKKTPNGNITFWSDDPDANYNPPNNRVIYVSIDGIQQAGQISNFQSIAPSSCVQSNLLFTVSTTQGQHTLTFTDNGLSYQKWSVTETIGLYSDCYVYYAPHR